MKANQINKKIISQYEKDITTIECIRKAVCCYFNIQEENLQLTNRGRESFVRPRQYAHFFSKKLTKLSLAEIGKEFGGKDHATVMHSNKEITNHLMYSDVRENVARIETLIYKYMKMPGYILKNIGNEVYFTHNNLTQKGRIISIHKIEYLVNIENVNFNESLADYINFKIIYTLLTKDGLRVRKTQEDLILI